MTKNPHFVFCLSQDRILNLSTLRAFVHKIYVTEQKIYEFLLTENTSAISSWETGSR